MLRRFSRPTAVAEMLLRFSGGISILPSNSEYLSPNAILHETRLSTLRHVYPGTLGSTRSFLDFYKFFNKKAIKKEKARLADELNRGYFADIHEFNKNGGKIAVANKTIIPSAVAAKFPDLEVSSPDDRHRFKLPINSENENKMPVRYATLLCLSFRASSQTMEDSWTNPFLHTFSAKGDIQIYKVSFIDSWILSSFPIRNLLLRIMKKSSRPLEHIVYSFGDHYDFRKKLCILNLLTGYAFLLDRSGNIRWQGFGLATQEEVSSLLSATSLLLDEK
ncbi:hypothetical protein ZOSMA_205G00050 [Zostera marina]|uniref:Mitochondrial ATPase complex subunit ATP10 n=1 Tax=Zostera marina TaxID=29655 RepID=A0A0K9PLJ3_ZOSMR|nr:hypothetical protein ZOSMA_205G00050 [Zostera marina]